MKKLTTDKVVGSILGHTVLAGLLCPVIRWYTYVLFPHRLDWCLCYFVILVILSLCNSKIIVRSHMIVFVICFGLQIANWCGAINLPIFHK